MHDHRPPTTAPGHLDPSGPGPLDSAPISVAGDGSGGSLRNGGMHGGPRAGSSRSTGGGDHRERSAARRADLAPRALPPALPDGGAAVVGRHPIRSTPRPRVARRLQAGLSCADTGAGLPDVVRARLPLHHDPAAHGERAALSGGDDGGAHGPARGDDRRVAGLAARPSDRMAPARGDGHRVRGASLPRSDLAPPPAQCVRVDPALRSRWESLDRCCSRSKAGSASSMRGGSTWGAASCSRACSPASCWASGAWPCRS